MLNMLDCDVSHLIDGPNIDRPFNAITLTSDMHYYFGDFKVLFEAIPNQEHTYQIDTFLYYDLFSEVQFPVTELCT